MAKQTTDPEGEGYTRYFYEGSRVVLEADADGAITAHNTYSINLASRTAGEEAYYYFYNAHGDVVGLSGAGGGEVVRYRYDAFGTPVSVEGDADNSITYAGYQYDAESGLYYLNARYYDSMTARFLTEDTYGGRAGDPLSLHRYTYCANNPLRYTDPSGHFFGALLRFVGGAVIGGVIEYVSQKFIEKREKVDWKAVAYEAVVGGVGAVFGGAGKQVAEGVGNAVGGVAKKVAKAAATEALWGGVEDVGKQVFVDGKAPGEFDYGELFDTMATAGVVGVFGAAVDFYADYRKHARLKKVPVPVEVERVHYECVYHVPDCPNHVSNIRVVTKDTKWEMQEVWEYGGTDRSFMDYLGDHAKEQVAGKAPEDAPWRKLNPAVFCGRCRRKNKKMSAGNILPKDAIQNDYKSTLDSIRNSDDLLTNYSVGLDKYQKASFWERITKKKINVEELHANPLDDFSNPKIGPCESAVSKYIKQINQTGKIDIPIEVQKLANGGYEIVNGHHRWLAAIKTGLQKVPIKIKNYSN